MKIRNPLIKRILILILSLAIFAGILYLALRELNRSYDNLTYDLGVTNEIYDDQVLTSFEEYKNLMEKYNLKVYLKEEHFKNNYYLASFQDYDKCSEGKEKDIKSIKEENNTLTITFNVHTNCGFCKTHKMLHLISIGMITKTDDIKYEYDYDETKDCGAI